MKKITLRNIFLTTALLVASFQSYAQLIEPGFYRIQVLGSFEGDNVVITPARPGETAQQPIEAIPLDESNSDQVFEVVYTGDDFAEAVGGATQVLNLVSITDSGNIESANQNNDGVRALTNPSGRANLRGATTENNEAGLFDDFYLEEVAGNPEAFRIRTAHTPFNGGERRLAGANSNSGTRFLNFGGFNGEGLDQFAFIPANDDILSTSDVKASDFFVSNPVSNELSVRGLKSNTIENISVYDVIGKEVLSASVNASQATLDVSSLISGLYVVKLSGSTGSFSTKIIKQ
jgi:hypothetical protein